MRAETGTMQFKDDWTGVFIRGDNAVMYKMALERLVHHVGESEDISIMFAKAVAEGLIDLLDRSNEAGEKYGLEEIQRLKSFEECI